jgi:hypothetical protein
MIECFEENLLSKLKELNDRVGNRAFMANFIKQLIEKTDIDEEKAYLMQFFKINQLHKKYNELTIKTIYKENNICMITICNELGIDMNNLFSFMSLPKENGDIGQLILMDKGEYDDVCV